MQHPNEQLLAKFYTAFQQNDYDAIAECYHEDAQFSDDMFENLRGDEVRAMWHMFTRGQASDKKMTFQVIDADDHRGRGRWHIDYHFSVTGRPIHNDIESEFRFVDGKIISHHDSFDFGRWTRQAFGFKGIFMVLGPIRSKVQQKIRETLQAHHVKNAEAVRVKAT
ncbi:nuclear transport factor 2 family protein [Tumebacillus permanentifrigoris]|uniref:Ketosteroid isomerase-like protein n=1 Tax=Tumebacillus permanentifrigoris TaxID=378543 RepID=A0A316DB26_9BACL|nr:nuclear transport factor 2 family protein [Tumebacillus permanentifrigoris]PWK14302.1 ketosteroid isomerase-like protein [Tumebacillus permanentifrigoris]